MPGSPGGMRNTLTSWKPSTRIYQAALTRISRTVRPAWRTRSKPGMASPVREEISHTPPLPRAGPLQRAHERLQVVRPIVARAIDEERGRAIDSAADPANKVFSHAIRTLVLSKVTCERLRVESERQSVRSEVAVVER